MALHTSFPSSPTHDRVRRMQLSDESDEDEPILPAQKRRRLSNILPAAPTPKSLPRRQSRRLQQGPSLSSSTLILSSSEDELGELPSSPARRRSRRLRRKT